MSAWTPERVETLTALASQGLSAQQIAMRIGGTTRNAVIGAIMRKGIPWKTSNRKTYLKPAPRRQSRTVIAKTIAPKTVKPAAQPEIGATLPLPMPHADDQARVTFAALGERHCKFIPGDPANTRQHDPLFCGLPRMPGSRWCEGHHARCCTPSPTLTSRNASRGPARNTVFDRARVTA